MPLQRRTIVIDHTNNKRYRSISKAYEDMRVQASTFRIYQNKYGNRFWLDGKDIELIKTDDPGTCAPIRCVETGVVYRSMRDAARAIKVSESCVTRHLLGKTPSIKNLHFRRIKEEKE